MFKKISSIFFVLFIPNAFASDFGTTGLIDIPTARMLNDGDFKITLSSQKIANITNLTYQLTPWMEATFRYTIFNPGNSTRNSFDVDGVNDRSYGAKIKILDEGVYKPQVAIGIQDMFGTGALNAEYIVASKKIQDFDFSIGFGWGRFADRSSFSNPLGLIDDRFENRNILGGGVWGGKSRFSTFFRGKDVGVFGGACLSCAKISYNALS